jgi:hypothetical protein
MSKTFHLSVNGTTVDFTEGQAEAMQEALSQAVKNPGQSIHRKTPSGPVSARMTVGGQSAPGGQSDDPAVLTDC